MVKHHINLKHSTHDKWTNNIFMQSILPMCFLNGHTRQTDKQHIHSKHFTHVFLEWTNRTNGQSTYSFKAFYPCLFRMNIKDKQTNNIFTQSILPLSFLNGQTGQADSQHIHSRHDVCPFVLCVH